ncbi:hypothetical protein LXL04_009344 [Taraxacum kok-saghyz]
METIKCDSGKKNILVKTWKRCQSIPPIRSSRGAGVWSLKKIKSWNGRENTKQKAAPEGCFPVCVGPEKQRFAVKTKYASHPLFTMLLEDSQTEYGFNFEGPILLPCDVNLFYQVLAEIEGEEVQPLGLSSFAYGSACSPFNPSRRLRENGADEMVRLRSGSYGRLLSH